MLTAAAFAPSLMADAPATAPSTMQSIAPVEVREWVVLVVDANQQRANARAAFPGTLPPFVTTHRAAPDKDKPGEANRATPIGVIRIAGESEPEMPLDVLLSLPEATEVQAHWPRAQVRSNRLLWRNLSATSAAPKNLPVPMPEKNWLGSLRSDSNEISWLSASDTRPERFLLYDVDLRYKSPLQIKAGAAPGDLELSLPTGPTLHDLAVYKRSGDGWTSVTVDSLEGAAPAPAKKPDAKKVDPAAAFDAPTTQPTTAPATQPAKSHTVTLAPAASDPTALLASWQSRLESSGVLPIDVPLVMSILQANAFDERWLTVVYRLDPAELERLLPLEVTPTPRKVTRVGIVILRNADPAIAGEIDKLIAQCGDADYQKRQEATRLLTELGTAARPKLEKAMKDKDPEIAFRVGRILSQIGGPQQK